MIFRFYVQGNPPEQPIALALSEALKTSNMSAMWMKRIITERVRETKFCKKCKKVLMIISRQVIWMTINL